MAKRYELTDEQFETIRDILPGKAGDPGRTAQDNHRFINGVMRVLRSGAHRKDMPERYGNANSTHKCFRRWANRRVWEAAFKRLLKGPKNDYVMIDSTLVKAHQKAATGKRGAAQQALGRSRGGLTTKIHMLCDSLGRLLHLFLTAGQKADCQSAIELLALGC